MRREQYLEAMNELRLCEKITDSYKETIVKYQVALKLIATPKSADGTYNRSREDCEEIAKEALRIK